MNELRRLYAPALLGVLVLAFATDQAGAVVSDVVFDWTTHRELAVGSDNWPITWADDDHQYTSWGDGRGFQSLDSGLGVARIEGDDDDYTAHDVYTEPRQGAKSYGILSIDGTLYMWTMVEGQYFQASELWFSTNKGVSWSAVPWRFDSLGSAFSVPTFLNFGKDYSGARDQYVYMYAPGEKAGGFASADVVYLSRVPKTDILNRNAYEFWTGSGWSANIADRGAVFSDPGSVHWTMSVNYSPGLGRYFLFNNSRANQSQSGASPSDFEIYEAPEPWGPWTLVKSFPNWNNLGYTFSYYLAPKWISADGRDFTLVFSGTGGNDSWNTVKGSFVTDVSDSTPPTVPQGLAATQVLETQISLTWQAASDPQSGVASYVVYRDGVQAGVVSGTAFGDQGLTPATDYSYEVSAINGAGLESPRSAPLVVTTAADTERPTIQSVTASVADAVSILFSEPVAIGSAQNPDNYTIDNGITVLAAQLGADARTVTLQTSTLSPDVTYTLTVTGVTDRATPPNPILPDTQVQFPFFPSLIGPVTTPGNYVWGVLGAGQPVYVDRTFTYTDVAGYAGLDYLRTANNDKLASDPSFITFDVTASATVFVAYDTRNSLPVWLQSWSDSGDQIVTTDTTLRLYSLEFAAGPVALGGNEMSNSMYTVIVEPATGANRSPVISGTPATSIVAGTGYAFTPTASDPDGDPLSFFINNQPTWAAFDAASGTLSGTPGTEDIGVTSDIRITVSDGSANASLPAFDLEVTGANRPPVISGTPATSVVAGTGYAFTPTASDPEGDPLSFFISNQPTWAAFDAASGTLSGTPGTGDVGVTSDIRITVSDGSASASLPAFSLQVTGGANRPPVISGTPATSVVAGTGYVFTPTASDPDGDPLSFFINKRPTWAAFDTASGTLSGTPGPGDVGITSDILITVSDGNTGASLPAFNLEVTADNQPPMLLGTPPTAVVAGTSYEFTPTAIDADGDVLAFFIENRPGWAAFDATTGTLSGRPGSGDVGMTTDIRISVSDGRADASLAPFDVEVTGVPGEDPGANDAGGGGAAGVLELLLIAMGLASGRLRRLSSRAARHASRTGG